MAGQATLGTVRCVQVGLGEAGVVRCGPVEMATPGKAWQARHVIAPQGTVGIDLAGQGRLREARRRRARSGGARQAGSGRARGGATRLRQARQARCGRDGPGQGDLAWLGNAGEAWRGRQRMECSG